MDRSSYRGGKHPPYCTCVKCESRPRKDKAFTLIARRFIAVLLRVFRNKK